jgi:hypothetical protein
MITVEDPSKLLFFFTLFGFAAFAYSTYWLYLSAGELWMRAIGSQNVVLLAVTAVLAFVALFLRTRHKIPSSKVATVLAAAAALVACFLNRAGRFADFAELILAFRDGHSTDPAVTSYAAIYNEGFLQYAYLVSRSSTPSLILLIIVAAWLAATFLVAPPG